ncbi:MAG: aldehyde dehydrogenase [Acidobacteria bacterium]|nr:aldehyde dehydrogenase [Acidobacteriota bacterium]
MAQFVIAGQATPSVSGEVSKVMNPATGEVVDTVPKGTREDVRRAIDSAEQGFKKWSKVSPAERGEILFKGAKLLEAHNAELAEILTKEQGKPLREAKMEIRRCQLTFEYYAGLGKNLRSVQIPIQEGRFAMVLRLPIGVCASIVPWNFPISLMGNKLAPGLLAGNAIVVKPASTTPLTDIRSIELLNQAGLPEGTLNVVTGPGSTVGQELLDNPKIGKIGFTGATVTGKMVMRSAAETLKRVTLELGGSDPLIICDDADMDEAVSAASVGRFFNCGQACLAVKRLYLFDSIADAFIEKLKEKVKRLTPGNGLNNATRVGPLHTADQRKEVEDQIADALKRGARVIAGGKRPEGAQYENGHFLEPTLVVDVPDDAQLAQDECFGPALPIFRVKSIEEAVERANNSIYGLGSSIFTSDLYKAHYAAEKLQAGYTWVNSAQIIFDELPFGGWKQSGMGHEHGTEALEHYTLAKSVVITPRPLK